MLFLVNMPFALSPLPSDGQERFLPLHADGGMTGADNTFAALDAIHRYMRTRVKCAGCRAVVLCYSVGDAAEERWEIVERTEQTFGRERVAWTLLREEKMWRINGVKSEPNPMSLAESLPKKAECQFYVRDSERANVREGYARLVSLLNDRGWARLGYGILDINGDGI